MSFGVSYSQKARNDHAVGLCQKTAASIIQWTGSLINQVNSNTADNKLTEMDAHNIGVAIFYDVQLEDAMKELGMQENQDLILAVNRLKSLQKLYLFEQKGGENYLG